MQDGAVGRGRPSVQRTSLAHCTARWVSKDICFRLREEKYDLTQSVSVGGLSTAKRDWWKLPEFVTKITRILKQVEKVILAEIFW
jgi:hypothetical protein